MASPRRQLASTLDTAALVFAALLALAVVWWVVRAFLGTLLFVGKLAVLAVAIAVLARLWFAARSRVARRRGPRA